jgi:hypothetical protein
VLTGSLLLFLSFAARSRPLITLTFKVNTAGLGSGITVPLLPLFTLLPGFGLPLRLGVVLGGFEPVVPFPTCRIEDNLPVKFGRTMIQCGYSSNDATTPASAIGMFVKNPSRRAGKVFNLFTF